jgi:hypothetical protein
VNNVIFNWRHRTLDGGDASSQVNCINNYYKPGPITQDNVRSRIGLPQPSTDKQSGKTRFGQWYVAGNVVEGDDKVTADNWLGMQFANEHMSENLLTVSTDAARPHAAEVKVDQAFPMPKITVQPAGDAYATVLKSAGAMLPKRDAVDSRIVNEVQTGKVTFVDGKGIITSIDQVGGYPAYKGAPFKDSDNDGLPDEWESTHGLDPKNPADSPVISSDGYSNIERFLNEDAVVGN